MASRAAVSGPTPLGGPRPERTQQHGGGLGLAVLGLGGAALAFGAYELMKGAGSSSGSSSSGSSSSGSCAPCAAGAVWDVCRNECIPASDSQCAQTSPPCLTDVNAYLVATYGEPATPGDIIVMQSGNEATWLITTNPNPSEGGDVLWEFAGNNLGTGAGVTCAQSQGGTSIKTIPGMRSNATQGTGLSCDTSSAYAAPLVALAF